MWQVRIPTVESGRESASRTAAVARGGCAGPFTGYSHTGDLVSPRSRLIAPTYHYLPRVS